VKKLNAMVNFVILGLLSEDDFTAKCQETLGLTAEDTAELGQIISREIFIPMEEIRVASIEKQKREEEEDRELFGEVPDTIFEKRVPSLDEMESAQEESLLPEAPMEGETFVLPAEVPAPGMIYPDATSTKIWERSPEVVPQNLPTEETTESFLPNLTPKTTEPEPTLVASPEVHPFEEKMQKVFTAGQQSMGDLTITQAVAQAPRPASLGDPYREPIE